MSVGAGRVEKPMDVVPGMPDVVDLADVWLVHALACLLDACDVPETDRRRLVESGIDAFEPEILARSTATDESVRLERLDACRRALVFAALALEARLNRVLRRCDAAEWRVVAHLAPVEKFRLALRPLAGPECATKDAELSDLVVQVFSGRDELVDADGPTGLALTDASSRFSPSRTRAIVEASAKICAFLATLTGGDESGTARLVWETAAALAQRADFLAVVRPSSSPRSDWGWNGFGDFPPDLTGS